MQDNSEAISDEAKLQIAQYFLLSSPPGQFQEVLSDVRRLLPENLLSDSLAAGIARAYNLKNGKVVVSPFGNKVSLSPAAETDPTHYIDPRASKTFSVEHLSLTTSDDNKTGCMESPFEKERYAIQESLNAYVKNKYEAVDSAGSVYVKDNCVVINVCGEKPNLRNYWSGRFLSMWSAVLSSGIAVVSGEIKVHAHYFEDGNVQMQSTKPIAPTSFTYTSPTNLADLIIDHINSSETALQAGFESMYASMNEETFKAMRRLMPITKTKMEWNVNAVRMVHQIRK